MDWRFGIGFSVNSIRRFLMPASYAIITCAGNLVTTVTLRRHISFVFRMARPAARINSRHPARSGSRAAHSD